MSSHRLVLLTAHTHHRLKDKEVTDTRAQKQRDHVRGGERLFIGIIIKLRNNFKMLLEKSFDEYLIIYFFSLVAIAEAVAAPPNIGSEIESGRGLVFSM